MTVKMRGVALLLVLAVAASFAATAAASCNPGRSNNHYTYEDGWRDGPQNGDVCLNGSLANVKVYSAYTVANTSAWTMIYYGTTGHYAQVGYERNPNAALKNFLQLNTASLGTVTKFPTNVPAPVVGGTPQYKVDFAGGYFHFFIGGTIVYTSANTSYGGCAAAQAGETQTLADQMPGGYSNHVTFTGSEVRNSSNNSWFSSFDWSIYIENAITGASASTYFGNAASWPNTDSIWDKACA